MSGGAETQGVQRGPVADATRARILAAARHAFSSRGYGDVGLREIAAGAGCDTALIRRYFGAKEALFEKALTATLDVSTLIDGARHDFGVRAVAFFTGGDQAAGQPLPMLIFATADPAARAIALRLLEECVVAPIAGWIGGQRGAEGAARISMLCSGYFLYRRILPLAAFADAPVGDTERWLATELQRVIDEI